MQLPFQHPASTWCLSLSTSTRNVCTVQRTMSVDPWVNTGTCPLLFEMEGMPCVLSPYIFGGGHFFILMHTLFTGRLEQFYVKFSKLILVKFIKIVATRCQILRLKSIKFNFGWGCAPDPAGGAYSAPPDTLAGLKGPNSKGRRGERREWKEGRGPLYFFMRIYGHATD